MPKIIPPPTRTLLAGAALAALEQEERRRDLAVRRVEAAQRREGAHRSREVTAVRITEARERLLGGDHRPAGIRYPR